MLLIRAATIADVPLLRKLFQELAEYEREPQAVLITEEELRRDGFGPDPKFRAIVAELDETRCDGKPSYQRAGKSQSRGSNNGMECTRLPLLAQM